MVKGAGGRLLPRFLLAGRGLRRNGNGALCRAVRKSRSVSFSYPIRVRLSLKISCRAMNRSNTRPLSSPLRSADHANFCNSRGEQTGGVKEHLLPDGDQAGVDIDARNSPLDLVFVRRLSKSSIASTVDSGLSTFRNTHTRLSSSGGNSSSSLRVPER